METTKLKYLKPSKYNTHMFSPIQITAIHSEFFDIKYDKYIFLSANKISCNDELQRNKTYKVDRIQQWKHNNKTYTKYYLKEVVQKTIDHYFKKKN